MLFHGNLASSSSLLASPAKKSVEGMAKPVVGSRRDARLRRSRNVPSLLSEESTGGATQSRTTMSVVADVHNKSNKLDRRQRGDPTNDPTIESLDDKTTVRRSSRDPGGGSSRANVTRDRRRDRGSRDDQAVDLIEELEAPRKSDESLDEKPRRRKQWNTANVANEAEQDQRKKRGTRRKRWSKDTSVIRLPGETSDEPGSPLISAAPRDPPVPPIQPRSSVRRNSLFFDNPAFTSENDDEVLRIETDHNRESTKIEIRRISDRPSAKESLEEAETTSGGSSSWRKNRGRVAAATSERFVDSDERSSKARSSGSRENSDAGKMDSTASLGKVIDAQSGSFTSEERSSSTSERMLQRERSLRKQGRPLLKQQPAAGSNGVSSSARDASSTLDADARARRKKRKKRKRKQGEKNGRQDGGGTKEKGETKHISVTIHRADLLEADYANVKRPMVRVHIVESRTGSYLASTTTGNGESVGGFLQPIITGKFDFKENRSMIPVWEEELIFQHDFGAITRREDGNQVVILFEVIDLLSFAEASVGYDRIGSEGCWNKIAWAFLKPIGVNNTLHTDKKVRLQLYRPRQSFRRYGKHKCEVYNWWQSNNRDKYPSSLFVTITSVSPRKPEPVIYQQLPLDDHQSDNAQSVSRGRSTRTSESVSLPKWARLAAQSCKIPNETMFETEASENGCFYVAFSNDGKYLACVHSEEYDYPIVVYEVETGKIHVRFAGHKTFVYSLNWSSNDHYLLSASADQTALIWDVRNQIIQHIEMLPHPSYVYCAKYGPEKGTIVATGCYDQVARIWTSERKSRKRELSQELEGHEGFVNSVAFQKSGNLITADSAGLIIIWTIRGNSRMPATSEWCISRKIKVLETEAAVINTITLHPLESRLLVHSRDNGLRLVDLATGVVLQRYKQLNNRRIQLKACISPCGGLVLCGGEDSVLNVWNLETGKHQASYGINDGQNSTRMFISCVDYHPYGHILAFSAFGGPAPVRILRFNKNASGDDVGLKHTEDASQVRGNEVILKLPVHRPPSQRTRQPSDDTVARKKVSPSYCPAIDRTIIQIEDDGDREQLWTKLRRLREMEQNWKKRSMDRLYRVIQKIDSMLSKTSMSSEDLAEAGSARRTVMGDALHVLEKGDLDRRREEFRETELFSVNERLSPMEPSLSSNVAVGAHNVSADESERKTRRRHRTIARERPKSAKEPEIERLADLHCGKPLSDSATSSMKLQADLFDRNDKNSTRFGIPIRANRFRDSAVLFEGKTNTSGASHVPSANSSDSAGTYTIKMHSHENKVKVEEINSVHETLGDDSSQISDATFIIEH